MRIESDTDRVLETSESARGIDKGNRRTGHELELKTIACDGHVVEIGGTPAGNAVEQKMWSAIHHA
jgi:hypothetical protein